MDKREAAQVIPHAAEFVNLIKELRSLNRTRATDLQVITRIFAEGFFPLFIKVYLLAAYTTRAYYHMFHATQPYVTNITYLIPYTEAEYVIVP
jgi:hypothetical protein